MFLLGSNVRFDTTTPISFQSTQLLCFRERLLLGSHLIGQTYHNPCKFYRGLLLSYLGHDIVHARNFACHHHLISSEWRERRTGGDVYCTEGKELLAGRMQYFPS